MTKIPPPFRRSNDSSENIGVDTGKRRFINQEPAKPKGQPIAITPETFFNILNLDTPGAMQLYMFYVLKCIDQNTTQCLAVDGFCARRLRTNIKTIRKHRKLLQGAGLVELIQKGRNNVYIRVNYMPFRIEGPSVHLGTDQIPVSLLGTYVVLDFYSVWFNRIVDKPSPFIHAFQERYGTASDDEILGALETIWDSKINLKGYGIDKVDKLSFFYYLLSAVGNKLGKANGKQIFQNVA